MHFLPGRFAWRWPEERMNPLDRPKRIGCNSIRVNRIQPQVDSCAKKHRRRIVVGPLFAFIRPSSFADRPDWSWERWLPGWSAFELANRTVPIAVRFAFSGSSRMVN
jgi:hypothetical protein